MTIQNTLKACIVAAVLLVLGGCAGTPVTDRVTKTPPPGVPQSAELKDVPFFAQIQYHCGPAALAAALNDTGLDVTPDGIAKQVYTPGRTGTLQTEIVTGSRRNGRLPIPVGSMEAGLREVAAGNPVLILQNLGLEMAPQWHYALLIGYDLEKGTAILRSGVTERLVMDLTTLEHTWRRGKFWGAVVAPPKGPVPVTAKLSEWMNEAIGLERVERADDAAAAYATAADHWADQAGPFIALANLYVGSGQLEQAESALRAALARSDTDNDAVALNNLANVLMMQKRWDEAEAYAEQAVDAGGPFQDAAEQTLAEIRTKRSQEGG